MGRPVDAQAEAPAQRVHHGGDVPVAGRLVPERRRVDLEGHGAVAVAVGAHGRRHKVADRDVVLDLPALVRVQVERVGGRVAREEPRGRREHLGAGDAEDGRGDLLDRPVAHAELVHGWVDELGGWDEGPGEALVLFRREGGFFPVEDELELDAEGQVVGRWLGLRECACHLASLLKGVP
ncbi:hypothetical protein VTK26DRAFT_1891 [Humicola hyalothermophila]